MEVEYTEAKQTSIQLSVLCLKCFKVVLLLFFFFSKTEGKLKVHEVSALKIIFSLFSYILCVGCLLLISYMNVWRNKTLPVVSRSWNSYTEMCSMMTSYPGVHQFTFFAFCSSYTRACICELGLNSCLRYIPIKLMRQESVQELRSDFSTADGRSAAIWDKMFLRMFEVALSCFLRLACIIWKFCGILSVYWMDYVEFIFLAFTSFNFGSDNLLV